MNLFTNNLNGLIKWNVLEFSNIFFNYKRILTLLIERNDEQKQTIIPISNKLDLYPAKLVLFWLKSVNKIYLPNLSQSHLIYFCFCQYAPTQINCLSFFQSDAENKQLSLRKPAALLRPPQKRRITLTY